jgi:fructosamine-3-kinase
LIDSFFVQWNEDQEKEKKAAEAAKAETVAKAKGMVVLVCKGENKRRC